MRILRTGVAVTGLFLAATTLSAQTRTTTHWYVWHTEPGLFVQGSTLRELEKLSDGDFDDSLDVKVVREMPGYKTPRQLAYDFAGRLKAENPSWHVYVGTKPPTESGQGKEVQGGGDSRTRAGVDLPKPTPEQFRAAMDRILKDSLKRSQLVQDSLRLAEEKRRLDAWKSRLDRERERLIRDGRDLRKEEAAQSDARGTARQAGPQAPYRIARWVRTNDDIRDGTPGGWGAFQVSSKFTTLDELRKWVESTRDARARSLADAARNLGPAGLDSPSGRLINHPWFKIQAADGTDLGTEETFATKIASFVEKPNDGKPRQAEELARKRSDQAASVKAYLKDKADYEKALAEYEKKAGQYDIDLSTLDEKAYKPPLKP